jgi:predicted amino acid racemase
VGSQDIASAQDLIPIDEGVTVVGCSSDHTIVDVSDARKLGSGDVLCFRVRYANMLYAFTGNHVGIRYIKDE